MQNTLYEKLEAYRNSDYYGFHMPGHKRNEKLTGAELPYGIDITEIEGFDDLHHAKGILKRAQERAAALYGAQESHYLVNGSTVGILSAILGCTRKGDTVLVARNCHKSVYHAIFLNELHAEYIYPEYLEEEQLNGEIRADEVRRILRENAGMAENKDSEEAGEGSRKGRIRAVVIVSPTYDGVVSDVSAIAEAAHEYGIPLIVDEAHGAHFGFHPYFPQNANRLGADVVIHSLHKTLPALTQTALIHINGNRADRERIEMYLHMLQSSSPSYVLMAGIDVCVDFLETKGKKAFEQYVRLLETTREKLKKLKYLQLVETAHYDRSKIVISTKYISGGIGNPESEERCAGRENVACLDGGWSGKKLYDHLLERYHLQMEMAAGSYIVAMTSVGDTKEGMDRLVKALFELDKEISGNQESAPGRLAHTLPTADLSMHRVSEIGLSERISSTLPRLEQVYTSYEAEMLKGQAEEKRWEECEGNISLEYAYLYPPGIPLIVPGERVSAEVIEKLGEYEKLGFSIEGIEKAGNLKVLPK